MGAVSTLARTVVTLAAIALFLPGVAYLFHLAANPWSWSLVRSDSLTGIWIGTLHQPTMTSEEPQDEMGKRILEEQLARIPPNARSQPKRSEDMAIMVKPHLQVFTWLTHVAGKATTCGSNGRQINLRFSMGSVTNDLMSLFLGNTSDPTVGGGFFEGARSGGDMAVTYRTADGTLKGTLHKGTEKDFQNACAVLNQRQ